MITVLCWYWRQPGGRTKYAPWHVNIWHDMVRRNLSLPHRIACVTDTPEGLDPRIEIIAPPRDFEHVRIPTWKEHRPQCLRRLAMFAPGAAATFGERFVCMDIDCVITGPLDPLLTDHDFRIFRGTSSSRPYNGSMMMLRAGARPQVYADFTPDRAAQAGRRFVGSDQAWITHCLGPGEATWGPGDGVVWHGGKGLDAARLIFFPGHDKPWERRGMPAVDQHYRRDPQPGYCLVLGRGKSVWSDAERELASGDPGAVIAMGETVQHWPRRVDAIAGYDAQAQEIAAMMGFSDVRICGATGELPRITKYSDKLQRRRARRAALA
jgi:hypothetical protein